MLTKRGKIELVLNWCIGSGAALSAMFGAFLAAQPIHINNPYGAVYVEVVAGAQFVDAAGAGVVRELVRAGV